MNLSDEDIEKIYQCYPRKAGKIAAHKAIRKALSKIAKGDITTQPDGVHPWPPQDLVAWMCERVADFARSPAGQAGVYTAHPASWFNGGRWADNRLEWYRGRRGQQHYKTPLEAVRAFREGRWSIVNDLDVTGKEVKHGPAGLFVDNQCIVKRTDMIRAIFL